MAKVKEGAEKAKEELENAKREIEKRAGALDGVVGANGRKDSAGLIQNFLLWSLVVTKIAYRSSINRKCFPY